MACRLAPTLRVARQSFMKRNLAACALHRGSLLLHAACGRLGLVAASSPVDLGNATAWDLAGAGQVAEFLGAGNVTLDGCCGAGMWCSTHASSGAVNASTPCFVRTPHAVRFANQGWLAGQPHLRPVFACLPPVPSRLLRSVRGALVAPSTVFPEVLGVLPESIRVGDRLTVDGNGFGSPGASTVVTVGGRVCAAPYQCDKACSTCTSTSQCGVGQRCVQFRDTAPEGFCLSACRLRNGTQIGQAGASETCPCGGVCTTFSTLISGAVTALCTSPEYSIGAGNSPCAAPFAPGPSTAGASQRLTCTLTSVAAPGQIVGAWQQPDGSGTVSPGSGGGCAAAGLNSPVLVTRVDGDSGGLVSSSRGAMVDVEDAEAACSADSDCVTYDMCLQGSCVAGCCVFAPRDAPRCASSSGSAASGALPPLSAWLPLPASNNPNLPVGPGAALGSPGDNISAASFVDDAPASRLDLAPFGFTFPAGGAQVSTLFVSPNGYLAVSGSAPCLSGFEAHVTTPQCTLHNSYTGLMAPIVADFNPASSAGSKVYTRQGPHWACAQWTEVPLFGRSNADNYTTLACIAADGSVQLRWAGLGLDGAPPNASVVGSWMSGVRTQQVPLGDGTVPGSPFAATGIVEATSRGASSVLKAAAEWSNASVGELAVATPFQTLLAEDAVREGATATFCSSGSVACASPRCGSSGGGTRVTIAWSGMGCGIDVQGGPAWALGGGRQYHDAGVTYWCRFGHARVRASALTWPSDAAESAPGTLPNLTCTTPTLDEVLGQVAREHAAPGSERRTVELVLEAEIPGVPAAVVLPTVSGLRYSPDVARKVQAGALPLGTLGSGAGPAFSIGDDVVPNIPVQDQARTGRSALRRGLVLETLTFTFVSNSTGGVDGVPDDCGCSGNIGAAADSCSACGLCIDADARAVMASSPAAELLEDCAGVCLGSAFRDTCEVCAGGTTGVEPDADVDCLGQCFGNATCSTSTGPTPGPTSSPDEGSGLDVTGAIVGIVVAFLVLLCIFSAVVVFRARPDLLGGPDGAQEFAPAQHEQQPGLSQRQLEALPVITFKGSAVETSRPTSAASASAVLPAGAAAPDDQAAEEGVSCAVCLVDLEVGQSVVQLPCNHLYHPECIKKWLQQSDVCPTCRFNLHGSLPSPRAPPETTLHGTLSASSQRVPSTLRTHPVPPVE